MKQLIFAVTASFCIATGSSSAQAIKHQELLGKPTDHSITIQLFYEDSAEVSVQYGMISGSYTDSTSWHSALPGEPVEMLITGLRADTMYYYRVRNRVPGASAYAVRAEFRFHTQRPAGKTFSFVVQADPHMDEQSDTNLYRRCLQNQLEDRPDFMIDLGDFLMSDKLKNSARVITHDTITYRSHLLRSYYETSCHSVPLFIALGNHEGESGWNLNGTPNNVAVWGTQDRKKYFLNPTPNAFFSGDTTIHNYVGQRANYYSWTWGDALFIVIDPYWYTNPKPDSLHGWRWTLGKTQYDWLKRTLDSTDAKFKFIFSHQIVGGDPDGRGGVEYADLYEWGGNNIDGTRGFETNRPGWYKPIKDLLTEHKVNIFFHGHDHFFGKQEKDCLIYQETPQPSLPNFTSTVMASDYGYFEGQILPNTGHIRVSVGPDGVKVDYVRAYLPANETSTRHNKDVSATYFIGASNCYDSLSTGVPVLWNNNYVDELIYPNPFHQETSIEFSVKKTEKTDLRIYDATGRLVKTLIAGSVVPAGEFKVIWDGLDFSGNRVASGNYYYSIQSESSGSRNGKIILY